MTSNELEIFKQSILDDVRVMMQTTGQVTQYIGARYVPLFADPLDWSNTKEYEPLTIVLHQGNSFTSRQFVPRGIDISNTEFWANTGNYNAQIEQYRQEVRHLDGRITANEEAIEALKKEKHVVTIEMFGGKANDSSFDNSDALKKAISSGLPVYFLGNCDYYFNTEINLPSTVYIEMHGFETTLHNFNIVFNAANNHWVHGYSANFSLIEGFNFMDVDPTKPVIYTGSAIKIHKCTTRNCGTLLALTHDYHDFVCLENVITYNPDVSHYLVSGFNGPTFTGTDSIKGDQIYFKQVHMAEIVPNDDYKTQLLCQSSTSYRIFNCLNCGCGSYNCDIYIHDSYFERFDLKFESTGYYSSNVIIDSCSFTHFVDFSNVKNVIFTNCVFKDACNSSFTINGIDYASNKFSNCTFQCSNDSNQNKRSSVCHEGSEIANTSDPNATISDFELTPYDNGTLPQGEYTVKVFPSVYYDKIEGKKITVSEHIVTLEGNSAIYGVMKGIKNNVKTCFLHIFITYPNGKTVYCVLPNSNNNSFLFTGRTINCLKVKDTTVSPTASSYNFARYGVIGISNSDFTSDLPIKANTASGKVISGNNWNL